MNIESRDLRFDKTIALRSAPCAIWAKFVALGTVLPPQDPGRRIRCTLPILIILALVPVGASAQGILSGISGFLDSNYTFNSTKTTDSSGNTTKTESNTFNNRLSLNVNTSIFPNLRLSAGALFEKDIALSKSDDTNTKSTSTKFNPFFNLTLSTPVYTAGIGYSRREDTEKASGSPALALVNEQYNAILGWKPDGFPSMDILLQRTNNFDEKRDIQNTTQDFGSLSSRFIYKNLEVRYLGSYTDLTDKINNVETTDLLQTGRLSYSDYFFNKRVSFNATYNITFDRITVSQKGKGTGGGRVSFQTFPFAGLSKVDNTLDNITLDSNPSLIDGNTAGSVGIDLISDPPLVKRQLGLDLLNPTEVNQLLLWVDRELTPAVASSFSWDVFISDDGSTWTHWAGPVTGSFGPFQNRFEIDFPNVTPAKRFIKVVTTPLTRTVLVPPNIFVTELQAFLMKTSAEVVGTGREKTTTTISHIVETEAKTRIFDIPLLYYDLSYFLSRSETDGSTRLTWTLSNGLSLNQTLSKVFSVTARAAREDGVDENEKRTAYVYNATIMATPLRTLRNSLVYGGRSEDIGGKSDRTNSVYLNNIAELYKGVDVNLGGGFDWATNAAGQKTQTTRINVGANMIPHPRMILTLNYSDMTTRTSGGGQPGSTTSSSVVTLTTSYSPFDTVRLLASLDISSQTGMKTSVFQNYAINWSPFPEGNLQFNISYNETLRSEDNAKERIFIPSMRWKITNKAFLDVSYLWDKLSSATLKSNSQSVNTSLKIFF